MDAQLCGVSAFNQSIDTRDIDNVNTMLFFVCLLVYHSLTTWAGMTSDEVGTFTACPNGINTPDGTFGPWCQGAKQNCFVPTDAPNDVTSNTPTKSPTNVPSDVPSKAPIESSVIPSVTTAGAPSSIRVVPSSGSSVRPSLPLTITSTISPS